MGMKFTDSLMSDIKMIFHSTLPGKPIFLIATIKILSRWGSANEGDHKAILNGRIASLMFHAFT